MSVFAPPDRTSRFLDWTARAIIAVSLVIGIGYPLLALVSTAVLLETNLRRLQVVEAVFWSTLDSAIAALVVTAVAGIVVALVRSLPRRLAHVFDVLLLIPAAFSPFVISGAIGRGLGRGGFLDPGFLPPFMGRAALLASFAVALFPYAYALLRVSIWNVPLTLIDVSRVNGASEWAIFKNTVWPSLRRGLPLAWLVVFMLAVSDPIVPTLLSYPHPNASRAVWVLTTALGDTGGAARISLALLLATFSLGALGYRILGSRLFLPTLHGSGPASNRVSFSQPVAMAIWPRIAFPSLVSALLLLPIVFMFHGARAQWDPAFPTVIRTAAEISVFTVAGSIVIAGSGLWIKARNPHSYLVDILFGLVLLMPGATTGTALSLAYGPSSLLAASLSPTSQSLLSSALIVIAYLTLSAPLTYLSVHAYGTVLPRQDFETALTLGASVAKAARVASQTWIRQSVVMSVTIVLAVSAVSVAPIMWVTTPSTPLLVPYLFRLVDHSEFGTASTLALMISAIVLLLLITTTVILSVRFIRKIGRS